MGNNQGLSDADTDMVNKMMDVIDSGLKRDAVDDEKARALFISLTLTATTTTARSLLPRNGDFIVDHIIQMSDEDMDGELMAVADEFDQFDGEVSVHKVVNGKRQKAAISEIMPSRTQRSGLNVDFVVNADETDLQSGSMSWSEASVDQSHKACGRSSFGDEKRARILALQNEVVTKDLTSTTYTTETAAATVTFSVNVACTSSGFTFAVPLCTARYIRNCINTNEPIMCSMNLNLLMCFPIISSCIQDKLFISITDEINMPL